MLRTLCASLFGFAILWATLPCAAADLEAACERFRSCYDNGGHDACWKRQESQLLQKRDAKASRDGRTLQIMTLRGPVVFTDVPIDCTKTSGKLIRYLGYFPDIGLHFMGAALCEGRDFIFVSHSTAETIFVEEIPHVSPSSKRIVIADTSALSSPSYIKMWALASGRMELKYSKQLEAGDYQFVRWEDDESFTVDEEVPERQPECQNLEFHYPMQHYTYHWTGKTLERSVAKEPNFRCQAIR